MATYKKHAVDVLKNSLFKDFQRANLFEVELNFPSGGITTERLELTYDMIQAISLPSHSLGQIEIKRMGRRMMIPDSVSNSPEISMTVYADVEGEMRDLFIAWQRSYYVSMESSINNSRGKFINACNMSIFTLDSNHQRRTVTNIKNVWPRLVGEMSLDNNTENSIMSFQITLAYDYATFYNDNKTT